MTVAVYQKACSKNVSGNTRIFIGEAANVTAITVTAGEVSAITGSGALKEIETDFDTILRTEEKISGKLNYAVDVSIDMKFSKPTMELNTLRDSLGDASPCGMLALVRDGNGTWWLVGYNELDLVTRPLYLAQDNFTSGAELIDPDGNKASLKLVRTMAEGSLPLTDALAADIEDGTALFCFYKEQAYCSEFQLVYNSWTTKPSDAVAAAMNTMVESLISAGVWAIQDVFYMFAVHTNGASEALTNWKNPGTNDATLVGAPAFVAFEGFTGASGKHINTNFNPSTEGVNMQQNSTGVWIYLRTNVSETVYDHGHADAGIGMNMQGRNASDENVSRTNDDTNLTISSITDCRGLWTQTRNASAQANAVIIYKNAANVGNNSSTSSALRNYDLFVLSANNAGSPTTSCTKQVAYYSAGGDVSSGEVTAGKNAIETYMDSNGKGVIP